MKRAFFLLLTIWFFNGASVQGANVDIGINLNIGAPAIVLDSPPEFLLIPALGLHISIGGPYDLFYLDGYYYHFHKNRWYRSNHYRGPWGHVDRDHLPRRILKHKYPEMIDWRDREYKNYRKDPEGHRDRYYRADEDHGGRKENHKGNNKGNKGHKEK